MHVPVVVLNSTVVVSPLMGDILGLDTTGVILATYLVLGCKLKIMAILSPIVVEFTESCAARLVRLPLFVELT